MSSSGTQRYHQFVEQQYFTPIEACCRRIADCITEMHRGDEEQTASLYSTLSRKLIDQTAYFIQAQRQIFGRLQGEQPSGTPTVRYFTPDLLSLQTAIELSLAQLRAILEPLPHEVVHEDWDKTLRCEIQTLDQLLTSLFSLLQSSGTPEC